MSLPATMSGVYLTRHGGPEALQWREDIPLPELTADSVIVKVLAAGVNNTDINTRIGWYASEVTGATVDGDSDVDAGGWSGALTFPLIQGGDLCGEIVALGEGVTNFRIGQRVICPINQPRPTADNPVEFVALGSEYNGAFAEYCAVPSCDLYDVTDAPLNDVELAAIPCAFGTAMGLLDRASVVQGDQILITGASGGVGMAAVQLARIIGAEVTGIASKAKHEAVSQAGAQRVIDRSDIPSASSYDAVIDLVAGESWPHLIDALRPGGRYAVAGAIAGPIVEADLRRIYLRDITLSGCTYQSPSVFQKLVDLVNEGRVKPLISKTYPLRDIAKAQEVFVSKRYPGKLVLLPQLGED